MLTQRAKQVDRRPMTSVGEAVFACYIERNGYHAESFVQKES